MAVLTKPQIKEFTNDLDRIAVSLGIVRQNGRLGNGLVLTDEQKDAILICQIKLFRSSSMFLARSISLDAASIKTQMIELQKASASIDKTLARIASVQQIVDLSELAISVAAAVATGNIVVVTIALNKLLAEIGSIHRQQ